MFTPKKHIIKHNNQMIVFGRINQQHYHFVVQGYAASLEALKALYPRDPYTEVGYQNLCRLIDHGKIIQFEHDTSAYQETIPATMVCCKTKFDCSGFTNTCPECGADYNWNGSLLVDRSYWGEETGEQYCDFQDQ